MLEILGELGSLSAQGGMNCGISYQEIKAYSELTCTPLSIWQVRTLFDMSEAFARMANIASDPTTKAPFESEDEERKERAKRVDKNIWG